MTTSHKIAACLAFGLLLLTGCTSRKVDVSMGSYRLETLSARAEKSEGVWTMDMELPVGRWKASLPEDAITPRVVEAKGRPHVRFDLPEGRLHDGRPIRLNLQAVDEEGAATGPVFAYGLSARVPGQGFIDFIFHLVGNASYRP